MKKTTSLLTASLTLMALVIVIHTPFAQAQDNGPMQPAGNGAPSMQGGQDSAHEGFFARLFHRGPMEALPPDASGPMMTGATAGDMTASGSMMGQNGGMRGMKPAAVGKVTAVSGTSITLTAMDGTTYTVDASSATFTKGMGKDSTTGSVSDIAVGDRIAVIGTVSGDSVTASKVMYDLEGAMMKGGTAGMAQRPGVFGTVASVSGSTLTVTGKDGTTYTVDASAATATKGMGADATTLSISDIKTGDTVFVDGTVSGSNIAATKITDGVPSSMKGDMGGGAWAQPAVSGPVTAVSGTTLTVTGKDGTAYTVDASAATFTKAGAADGTSITIASIAVGDNVAVEGTATGTSVTATKVIDGVSARMMTGGDATASGPVAAPTLLKKIGSFFGHLKFW